MCLFQFLTDLSPHHLTLLIKGLKDHFKLLEEEEEEESSDEGGGENLNSKPSPAAPFSIPKLWDLNDSATVLGVLFKLIVPPLLKQNFGPNFEPGAENDPKSLMSLWMDYFLELDEEGEATAHAQEGDGAKIEAFERLVNLVILERGAKGSQAVYALAALVFEKVTLSLKRFSTDLNYFSTDLNVFSAYSLGTLSPPAVPTYTSSSAPS